MSQVREGAVTVLGAIVVDFIWRPSHLPQPGETVLAPTYSTHPGGKGANQALASSRAGARTRMIGVIGDDAMGPISLQEMDRAGVDISTVQRKVGVPTGASAVIVHGDTGENQICVGVGANKYVCADQFDKACLADTCILVLQMEIPLEQNWLAVKQAKAQGIQVVVNVAPAGLIPEEALNEIDFLVVNEEEARCLVELYEERVRLWCENNNKPVVKTKHWDANGGIAAARTSLMALSAVFNTTVIITLGPAGAEAFTAPSAANLHGWVSVSALDIKCVDTVGAGDAFVGSFVAGLAVGDSLEKCMQRGAVAGSLACTKHGAQEGAPTASEININISNVVLQNAEEPPSK